MSVVIYEQPLIWTKQFHSLITSETANYLSFMHSFIWSVILSCHCNCPISWNITLTHIFSSSFYSLMLWAKVQYFTLVWSGLVWSGLWCLFAICLDQQWHSYSDCFEIWQYRAFELNSLHPGSNFSQQWLPERTVRLYSWLFYRNTIFIQHFTKALI